MKFKEGEKYTIQFLDHCKGDVFLLCEVAIWIIRQDKTAIYGTWWRVISEDDKIEEDNREPMTILKSTIKKSKKLERLR